MVARAARTTHLHYFICAEKAVGATSWIIKAVNHRTDGPKSKLAVGDKRKEAAASALFQRVFHFCATACATISNSFPLGTWKIHGRAASKWAASSKLVPPPTQSEKRALLFPLDSSGYIRHLPFLGEIRSGEHLIMFHLQESRENFCCFTKWCSRNPLFRALQLGTHLFWLKNH